MCNDMAYPLYRCYDECLEYDMDAKMIIRASPLCRFDIALADIMMNMITTTIWLSS